MTYSQSGASKGYGDIADELNDQIDYQDEDVFLSDSDQEPTPSPAPSDDQTPPPTGDTPNEPPQWARGLMEDVRALGGLVHTLYGQQQAPPQPQQQPQQLFPQPQRQPTRPVWDNEFEALAHEVQAQRRDARDIFKNSEVERFRSAEDALRREYGDDFDKMVPPAVRANTLNNFLADAERMDRNSLEMKWGHSRLGWKSQLESAFAQKHYAELRKQKNEQTSKQSEQRETRKRDVARIPAGGATHQESRIKPAQYQRGYSDVTKAAKAEIEAMFGG